MVQRLSSAVALLAALIAPALTVLLMPTNASSALVTAGAVFAVLIAVALVHAIEWVPALASGPQPGVMLREGF